MSHPKWHVFQYALSALFCVLFPAELGIGTEDEPLGGKFKPYAVRGTMQYHQWLYKLYYTVIPSIRNIDFRRSYITCVQHLVVSI